MGAMIDVAVIGAGAISSFHLDGYLGLPRPLPRRRGRRHRPGAGAAADRGVPPGDAVAFDSVDAVLNDGPHVDLASVCTPPSSHAEIAARLLDAGVNTLLEKPMAPSLAECDAILAAADRGRRGPVGRRAEPLHQPDDAAEAGARLGAGRPGAARPGRLALVARPQLLRPVVARHLAERGRRLHAQPRRPPHRRAAVDDRNAGGDPGDDRQRRPRQLRGRGPVAGDPALP